MIPWWAGVALFIGGCLVGIVEMAILAGGNKKGR